MTDHFIQSRQAASMAQLRPGHVCTPCLRYLFDVCLHDIEAEYGRVPDHAIVTVSIEYRTEES